MKKRLIAFLLALVILVPCAAASAATYYRLNTKLRLWILPDYNSKVLDTYRQDWALTVGKNVDKTWAFITFTNGRTGYLERKYLVRDKSYAAWITKDNTKLKHGPGSTFYNEGTANRGDKVTVLTHGRNYSYVKSGSTYGYVLNSLLSKKKVTSAKPGDGMKNVNYTAWVVSKGGQVGLRSAPSGSSSVVFKKYGPGTKITVLKEGSEFHYVKIGSETGYMRKQYISKSQPAATATPVPAPSYPYTATVTVPAGTSKAPVYMGEGLGWSISLRLPAGASVKVVAPGKDPYWVKVEVNNYYYYMQKKYLK